MKESLSIKALNNNIDKLFEDELEDVKIIKDIKDVIARYENANDYKLKSRLASSLRSLSTQLRDFQRNNINKDNSQLINQLIDYIESKSDLKFKFEKVDNNYGVYKTVQKCINDNIFMGQKEKPCFVIVSDSRTSSGIFINDYIDHRDRSKFHYMPFVINDKLTDRFCANISDTYIKTIGDRIIDVYNDNKDNLIN